MKTKIIPASRLSSKTLRARDYVLAPFKVIWAEQKEKETIVHLDATTAFQAESMLEGMSYDDLTKILKAGETRGNRIRRWIVAVVKA